MLTVFVTHEVQITTTQRRLTGDVELERASSYNGSIHSSHGSQVDLQQQLEAEKISRRILPPSNQYVPDLGTNTYALGFLDSDAGMDVQVQSLSRNAQRRTRGDR
jgi:hypothetical protein